MSLRIKAFADLGESVTLRWLRGLRQDERGDWWIEAALQGHASKAAHNVSLAFGHAPLLAPGRVFHQGKPAAVSDFSAVRSVEIASLRRPAQVSLAEVPPSVFSDGKRRNSDQPLLLYATPQLDLYVPPLEMVRRLFLHDKLLANAILRRGALAELCLPVAPSFHDDLTLEFTAAMAPGVLTRAFVRDYAWLAVHPTGARAWNSVARLSSAREGILLDPPEIRDCSLQFRGLFGDGAALVLEILEIPGKVDPFRRLEFTHPTLKKRIAVPSQEDPRERKAAQARQRARIEKEHEIDSQPSRVGSRPDVVDDPRTGSDFIGDRGAIDRRYILQEVAQSSKTPTEDPASGKEAPEPTPPPEPQRRIIPASVAEIAALAKLPPLSFRILEPAEKDHTGGLRALTETLRRMQALLPSVAISSALCVLPERKRITWTGRYRRACLIALFLSSQKPPVVLLDVDHSDDVSLAALALHFRKASDLEEVERAVASILGRMDKQGRWPPDLEAMDVESFRLDRIKRLLRSENPPDAAAYQTNWAHLLIERLGLKG